MPRTRRSTALWRASLLAAVACSRTPSGSDVPSRPSAALPQQASSAAPVPSAKPLREPNLLFNLDVAAYSATLAVDDDDVYVFTSDAAYRLSAGRAPLRRPLDLGIGPVLTTSSIVFWSKGSVWSVPKEGGTASVRARLPHQPQTLLTSGSDVAFLDRSDAGKYTIQALDGTKPRMLYGASGTITTATMLKDWVFFVEQAPDGSWRIGGVSLSGNAQAFTPPKTVRTPAMLAATSELFYYDGPSSTVHRLSPDFARDDVIADNVICSPIAVAQRVFCGHVEGLFEIPSNAKAAVALTVARRGPIAAVAASARRVAWLVDAGPNKLAVETLSLE